MTMKRSLAAVREHLAELSNVVRELAVAVDDGPVADRDLAVIESLRAHAAEVEGDATETETTVAAAFEAEEAGDPSRAARLLADAHERFNGLGRRVRFGLSGHGSIFEIERLAAHRGAGWRPWTDVVLRQLELIDHALQRTDGAFITCWQEVADRTASAVSVTSTSIAQKIAVHPSPQRRHSPATQEGDRP
jgi:hypothetical protein